MIEPTNGYRYRLERSLGRASASLLWVMFNPSTADDLVDDPTIRRCIGFAKAAGYGRMSVVNLFAARATRPARLLEIDDPVGPDNDDVIKAEIRRATTVAFAFGATRLAGLDVDQRWKTVDQMCLSRGIIPKCLGMTKDGWPRHPLYVPSTQRLVEWEML